MPLPDDVDPRLLDADARRELRSLSKDTSDLVARHLVMTGRLLDDEPEQALAHARAARALAGRIGVVREAAGLAAYAAGEWAEALSELRAARRITGQPEHLGVFADCERALGRPERALAYADDPQLSALSQDQRVELAIVLAGARRDLGQADAAVLSLQDPARRTTEQRPWAARLWYAYADALLDAGREEQAREWFGKVAAVDVDGLTDAGDRLLALDGLVLEDFDDDDDDEGPAGSLLDDAQLAELVDGIRPLVDGSSEEASEPAGSELAEEVAPAAEPAVAEEVPARSSIPPVPQSAPEVAAVLTPTSAVAAPTFVAPPNGGDDDLRLFE